MRADPSINRGDLRPIGHDALSALLNQDTFAVDQGALDP